MPVDRGISGISPQWLATARLVPSPPSTSRQPKSCSRIRLAARSVSLRLPSSQGSSRQATSRPFRSSPAASIALAQVGRIGCNASPLHTQRIERPQDAHHGIDLLAVGGGGAECHQAAQTLPAAG